jgi:thioredoxin
MDHIIGQAQPASANTAAMIVDGDQKTFMQEVIEASRQIPVLVDFWATWCPLCRAIAPVLEQLSAESDGRYEIGKLDVDQNQRTAAKFQIEGIPTLLIFKSGQLVDRLVGAHPKQAIAQRLAAHA